MDGWRSLTHVYHRQRGKGDIISREPDKNHRKRKSEARIVEMAFKSSGYGMTCGEMGLLCQLCKFVLNGGETPLDQGEEIQRSRVMALKV